jgi:hypothetical protein
MVDFVTAFATAGNAIKLVSELRGIQKAFDEAEWKLKIAELNGALAELKNALIDAKQELSTKDEELKLLGDNFLVLKDTVETNGYRYDKKPDGQPTGHPYCPVCLQKDGYMFHTTLVWAEPGRPEQCPHCKAKYQATVYS